MLGTLNVLLNLSWIIARRRWLQYHQQTRAMNGPLFKPRIPLYMSVGFWVPAVKWCCFWQGLVSKWGIISLISVVWSASHDILSVFSFYTLSVAQAALSGVAKDHHVQWSSRWQDSGKYAASTPEFMWGSGLNFSGFPPCSSGSSMNCPLRDELFSVHWERI